MNKIKVRDKIAHLEDAIKARPDNLGPDPFPLEHSFAPGLYARQVTCPAGAIIVTKLHKTEHFIFMLKGRVQVVTEDGAKEIIAPCMFKNPVGAKRAVHILEETVWVNVHHNPENIEDLNKLEDALIAEDYPVLFDIAKFRELTTEVIAHEKDGFWSDWNKEQQEVYSSGDWEKFSKLRGYTEEEILNFKKWLLMIDEGEKIGVNPLMLIADLTTEAAINNMKKDKNNEILLSSHLPCKQVEV